MDWEISSAPLAVLMAAIYVLALAGSAFLAMRRGAAKRWHTVAAMLGLSTASIGVIVAVTLALSYMHVVPKATSAEAAKVLGLTSQQQYTVNQPGSSNAADGTVTMTGFSLVKSTPRDAQYGQVLVLNLDYYHNGKSEPLRVAVSKITVSASGDKSSSIAFSFDDSQTSAYAFERDSSCDLHVINLALVCPYKHVPRDIPDPATSGVQLAELTRYDVTNVNLVLGSEALAWYDFHKSRPQQG